MIMLIKKMSRMMMFKAQVPTSACFVAISITVSLLFPTTWRQDQAFAKQLKWLMVAQMYMAGHMVVNNIFFNFVFFISLPSYLQWLAAFALPGIRELSEQLHAGHHLQVRHIHPKTSRQFTGSHPNFL